MFEVPFCVTSISSSLQGRLASINDIPLHAKYLFEEPDFESEEAQGLLAQISTTDVGE